MDTRAQASPVCFTCGFPILKPNTEHFLNVFYIYLERYKSSVLFCRCFYRPQKPFKDYIEKVINGKVHAAKPTARDLQVTGYCMLQIAWYTA